MSEAAAKTYTTRPYRLEFPDSSERGRSCKTLEDALSEANWKMHWVWRETTERGVAGEHVYDTERAVITNRNTGYRWILRRSDRRVEFQTPAMFEEQVADQGIELYLTVEEAEALARAASSTAIKDQRTKALINQALDQVAMLCARVRERIRGADEYLDWARGIPRRPPDDPDDDDQVADEATETEQEPHRKRREREYVSLKGAARIIGKAPSTLYKWYREGKFPPAVDLSQFSRHPSQPSVIVPLDRLEAWRNGERMRPVLQEVFEFHGLHEPPWLVLTVRKGVKREDVDYWIEKRNLVAGFTKDGKRIYGEGLDEQRKYELFD